MIQSNPTNAIIIRSQFIVSALSLPYEFSPALLGW